MTLAELRTLTLSWLDDTNAGYFTIPQVDVWLNNAQKEVQKLLLQAGQNYYMGPCQTTLVVNQSDYVLPQDFVKLHRLEIVISGVPPFENTCPIAPITLNQQDLVPNQTGRPQFYFLKKNRIVLWPAPDSALTLRLYYSPLVADMTLATDIPNVPYSYHEMLAVLATVDGMLKDQRDPSSVIMKRTYYETMLKQDAQERLQDAPRSIVQTGEGAGYSFGYF